MPGKALFLLNTNKGLKGGGERWSITIARELARRAPELVEVADEDDALARSWSGYGLVHSGPILARARKARRERVPYVFTDHASHLGTSRHGWATGRGGIYRAGQLAVYSRDVARASLVHLLSRAAMGVSQETCEDLRREALWAKDRVYRTENGVDTSHFVPAAQWADDGYVLFVGRVERSKGIDTLLEAAAGASWPVKVVGVGSQLERVRRAKSTNVELVGEVDDAELIRLYQRASVAVFPSLFEGYGLVALEALACGTPAVVSDAFRVHGPARGLLRIAPQLDARAWRAAIDATLGGKSAAWSARAVEIVRAHHDVSRQVGSILRLYRHVLDGKPGVPRQTLDDVFGEGWARVDARPPAPKS